MGTSNLLWYSFKLCFFVNCRPDDKWHPFVSFVNPEDYVSIIPPLPAHHSERSVDRMMIARQLMESYDETDGYIFFVCICTKYY